MNPQEKPVILIVEDDAILSTLTKTMLTRMGYEVSGCESNVQDAFKHVVQYAPDLVLMDINLGTKFDGIDGANYIYHSFNTPVVFLTGNIDMEVLERAKSAEPFGYVTKPFTKEGICATIEVAYNAFLMNNPEMSKNRRKVLDKMASDDAYILINETGTIIFMNPYAERITGASYAKAFLVNIVHVLTMKDRQSPVRFGKATLLQDLLTAAMLKQTYTVTVTSRSGKTKNARLTVSQIKDRQDRGIGYIVGLEEILGRMMM
ncbi:ATP-binding response regulator [Methanofollis fontis]|uniref:Response regulatory domain-containing protein n=1 Tax=Methanofollis fontis TaxID=2052832 RepID=A0A483CPG7_9EURY|nr:response regulator [Methanofollis fontis]TAJ44932.1 hypothetical protein CUJ86_06535 [Methanofollis fontis]